MRVTIISSEDGDWSGVYFDNLLKTEGHSVRHDELLDELILSKKIVTSWKSKTVFNDFLEESGSLPSELSLIPDSEYVEYE